MEPCLELNDRISKLTKALSVSGNENSKVKLQLEFAKKAFSFFKSELALFEKAINVEFTETKDVSIDLNRFLMKDNVKAIILEICSSIPSLRYAGQSNEEFIIAITDSLEHDIFRVMIHFEPIGMDEGQLMLSLLRSFGVDEKPSNFWSQSKHVVFQHLTKELNLLVKEYIRLDLSPLKILASMLLHVSNLSRMMESKCFICKQERGPSKSEDAEIVGVRLVRLSESDGSEKLVYVHPSCHSAQ
eukprot:TRINITY_DN247366_c0_g1_i1.p1 TRINITY_DN247366_c0_g1~~TRINITY_DN247366_c0_g1_i1.p1  ORF type:complete len:244 (+),score=35.59 TRINITY_DN247366_c0_g1_i1:131-862(+)